jgi:hypothetical protein
LLCPVREQPRCLGCLSAWKRWLLPVCSHPGGHGRSDGAGELPYAFAAMRELIRRRNDVRAVVLPGLTHVQHIVSLAQLSHDALACHLGTVVLLAAPPHDGAPVLAILGPVQHEKEGRP